MVATPYIVAFFSTMLGGYLMDKVFHGVKSVSLISYIIAIPILFYIGQIEKGNHAALLVMLVLNGFFVNLIWGVVYAYPQIRYLKHVVGSAVGFSNGVGQLGAFISPLLAGYLVQTSSAGAVYYGNVFIMFAIFSGIAAISVCLLNESPYQV